MRSSNTSRPALKRWIRCSVMVNGQSASETECVREKNEDCTFACNPFLACGKHEHGQLSSSSPSDWLTHWECCFFHSLSLSLSTCFPFFDATVCSVQCWVNHNITKLDNCVVAEIILDNSSQTNDEHWIFFGYFWFGVNHKLKNDNAFFEREPVILWIYVNLHKIVSFSSFSRTP